MSNPTPNDHVQNLLKEQSDLLANKALLGEQLADTDKRLAVVRAALEGVNLGRALAGQEAENKEAQLAVAKAAEAALDAQAPTS